MVWLTSLHSSLRPVSGISCKLNKFQLDNHTNEISLTLLKLREDRLSPLCKLLPHDYKSLCSLRTFLGSNPVFFSKKNNMQTLELNGTKNLNFWMNASLTYIQYMSHSRQWEWVIPSALLWPVPLELISRDIWDHELNLKNDTTAFISVYRWHMGSGKRHPGWRWQDKKSDWTGKRESKKNQDCQRNSGKGLYD